MALRDPRNRRQRDDRDRVARLAADHGDVVLWARSDASAKRASTVIEDAAAVVTELEALRESTLVIEAVAEDLKVKTGLYKILADVLPAEVPVATTTSALSVQELAEASGRPSLFAGVHFFNPVDRMELVELCFPREATEEDARALPCPLRAPREDGGGGP